MRTILARDFDEKDWNKFPVLELHNTTSVEEFHSLNGVIKVWEKVFPNNGCIEYHPVMAIPINTANNTLLNIIKNKKETVLCITNDTP